MRIASVTWVRCLPGARVRPIRSTDLTACGPNADVRAVFHCRHSHTRLMKCVGISVRSVLTAPIGGYVHPAHNLLDLISSSTRIFAVASAASRPFWVLNDLELMDAHTPTVDGQSMTGLRRTRNALVERIAVAAFAVIVADVSCGQASVELHSIGPAEGFPGTVAAWAYVTYGMSVDCSPPRACYAKSQWIYAYVSCDTRSLAMIQRISMDLNGNVVAIANAEQLLFYRPNDPGGVILLTRLCGYVPDRDDDDSPWRTRRRS